MIVNITTNMGKTDNQLVIITFNDSKPLVPSTERYNYDDVVIVTNHVVVFTKQYL